MNMQYNPYAAPQAMNRGGVNNGKNPFMQNEEDASKKYSVPTWLLFLIIALFIGFAVALWFML